MSYKIKKQYRFQGYDYCSDGFYFITFNTKNREHSFGEVINSSMNFSLLGNFVFSNINKFIINYGLINPYENNIYFQNNDSTIIGITEFAILPNHIHLIVEIVFVGTRLEACSYEDKPRKISYNNETIHPLIKKSVSAFVNHFKGKVKRFANEKGIEFEWQPRFYDRIIRDYKE